MNFAEAAGKAKILRDAIVALETAEGLEALQPEERTKLYTARNSLEHALLRMAIAVLEQEMEARRRQKLESLGD
jgi:hypothetical protein